MPDGFERDGPQGPRFIYQVRAISFDLDDKGAAVYFPSEGYFYHALPFDPNEQCFLGAAEQSDRSDWC